MARTQTLDPERPPVRQRDAALTRERLLDAAEAQFARSGFAGSRVDEIARAAGVNVQLIYRYFGDKAGLYQAAFDRLAVRAMQALARSQASAPPIERPRERFAAIVGAYWEFIWDDPAYGRMTLWSLAERTSPHDAEPGEGFQALIRLADALIREAIAAGILRADISHELFVTTLVSLCLGQYGMICGEASDFPRLDPRAPAERERMRTVVVDCLLGAFGTATGGPA